MIKSLAIAAAAALALTGTFATPSQALGPQPGGDPLEWCLLSGGETIPQPPGSGIAACCVDGEGCVICNADWSDCTYDPPYSTPASGLPQHGGADRLAPPSQGGAATGQFAPQVLRVQ